MSLMNCPECGGEMSEFAKSCPRCGMPNKKTTENKKSKLKTIMSRFKILIVIIISVITLLVIGMILYRFSAKYIMNKFIDAYNNRDIEVINKLMYTELLDFEKEDYFKDDGDAVIVSYNLDYVISEGRQYWDLYKNVDKNIKKVTVYKVKYNKNGKEYECYALLMKFGFSYKFLAFQHSDKLK